MLTIKNAADIEKMKAAGRLTEDVLKLMAEMAKPGVTTEELDRAAEELIRSRGGSPSCLGYNGYPKTICTSVNEQVVHGIPGKSNGQRPLRCLALAQRLVRDGEAELRRGLLRCRRSIHTLLPHSRHLEEDARHTAILGRKRSRRIQMRHGRNGAVSFLAMGHDGSEKKTSQREIHWRGIQSRQIQRIYKCRF